MNANVADLASLSGRRVVVGVTGGIAAYKAPLVVRRLLATGATVDVVLTRGGARFVGAATFAGLTGRKVRTQVWEDIEDETHVALGRVADVIAVYPATAHTMARAATGMADDLLTTTLLATTAPVVMAPAMHTEMWQHPATRGNAATLRDRGVTLVGPAEGFLMGGDSGTGRAVEPDEFVAAVVAAMHHGEPGHPVDLAARRHGRRARGGGPEGTEAAAPAPLAPPANMDLAGRRVLVTAGGTREPIDPVRHLGNASSGRMGHAVATAAARRGADVLLVSAPTSLDPPAGVTRVDVVTAQQMHDEVVPRAADMDVVVKAAAVADHRPVVVADHKLKKSQGLSRIELEPTPDILATIGRRRADGAGGPRVLVGFAAETDDVEANGAAKLAAKQCDLLVVNDVTAEGAGFGHDTNEVLVLGTGGLRVAVSRRSKHDVADRLLDVVVERLAGTDPDEDGEVVGDDQDPTPPGR